jgi:hypothetical protein
MTSPALYDWSYWPDHHGWRSGPDAPCVRCDHLTMLRSPKGLPLHMVCAEDWSRTINRPARRHEHADD